MKINGSTLAALVMAGVALGGIVAPIFSSWIHEYFTHENKKTESEIHKADQLKEIQIVKYNRQADLLQKEINVLSDYLQYTSDVLYNADSHNIEIQNRAFGNVLIYLPMHLQEQAFSCQNSIRLIKQEGNKALDLHNAIDTFKDLAANINNEIESLQKQLKQE